MTGVPTTVSGSRPSRAGRPAHARPKGAGKPNGHGSRRQRAGQRKRARTALLLALVLLAGVGLGVGLWAAVGRPAALTPRVATVCQKLVVPAYFTVVSEWGPAEASTPEPSTMILGVTSTGPGSAPNASLQAFVRAREPRASPSWDTSPRTTSNARSPRWRPT